MWRLEQLQTRARIQVMKLPYIYIAVLVISVLIVFTLHISGSRKPLTSCVWETMEDQDNCQPEEEQIMRHNGTAWVWVYPEGKK